MKSYMFFDLEPGSSLGDEGAVHGGECTAGKAKISWLRAALIAGQWSISKSIFSKGFPAGTMKLRCSTFEASAIIVEVCESICGHERGSCETFVLSVDHGEPSTALQILPLVVCCGSRLMERKELEEDLISSVQLSTNLSRCCVKASVLLLLLFVCAWARPIGW